MSNQNNEEDPIIILLKRNDILENEIKELRKALQEKSAVFIRRK